MSLCTSGSTPSRRMTARRRGRIWPRSTPSASNPSIAFSRARPRAIIWMPASRLKLGSGRNYTIARRRGLRTPDLWRRRFGVYGLGSGPRESEDIRMFVLYHDPALTPAVPHSLGLTKGLIGVVYAFAAPEISGANNVVIAHELLHTVGATDKYDFANDAPRFPDGYGDPAQTPLFPQQWA